jgi:protein-disulfide isomerase
MTRKNSRKSNIKKTIREERVRKQRQQRLTQVSIISGAILLVFGLAIYPSIARSLAPVSEYVKLTPEPRSMADFNAMGDPNAPVKIIEYSDFLCSYCKLFSDETEKLIIDNYVATGKVYFVYVPYGPGGNAIGQESGDAAKAAFCAADQGQFWQYHDMLFANQTGENVGDYAEKRLKAYAEYLGLNMDEFTDCYRDNKFATELAQGVREGIAAKIQGTPSFLVNGKLIEGAQPYPVFEQEIEAALATAGVE